MNNAYAGGGDFDHFVGVAQQQMTIPQRAPISLANFNEYASSDGWVDAFFQLVEVTPPKIMLPLLALFMIGGFVAGRMIWIVAKDNIWFKAFKRAVGLKNDG